MSDEPATGRRHPLFLDHDLIMPAGVPGGSSLELLHRAAGCRCFVVPAGAVCPECEQGKCGNCDTTAWDLELDEPTACTCTHQ